MSLLDLIPADQTAISLLVAVREAAWAALKLAETDEQVSATADAFQDARAALAAKHRQLFGGRP